MRKASLIIFTLLLCVSAGIAQTKGTTKPQQVKEKPDPSTASHHIMDLFVGMQMPADHIKMMNPGKNEQVSLADVATKQGLIVMFSCNTCPYVIKAQEHTKEIMKYAKENAIGMIIINSNEAQRGDEDSPPAMENYYHHQQYTVPYVVDRGSMMADIFGATHTPEVFLFNGEGKLIYKGALEDNPSDPPSSKKFYMKDALVNMMANVPVTPKTTRSIGCSIKRAVQ